MSAEQEREQVAQDAAEDLELNDETAKGVAGGDKAAPVTVQDVSQNKQRGARKNDEGADALVRF